MVREISMQMIFTWTNGLPSFGTCNRLDALAGHVVQGDVDQERDQLHLDGHGVQENDFLYLSSGQIAAELPTWDQMFHRKTTFWEEAKLTGSSSSSPEEECFLLVAHLASSPSPLLHLWRNEINKKNSIAPQSKKATQKDEKSKAKKMMHLKTGGGLVAKLTKLLHLFSFSSPFFFFSSFFCFVLQLFIVTSFFSLKGWASFTRKRK